MIKSHKVLLFGKKKRSRIISYKERTPERCAQRPNLTYSFKKLKDTKKIIQYKSEIRDGKSQQWCDKTQGRVTNTKKKINENYCRRKVRTNKYNK